MRTDLKTVPTWTPGLDDASVRAAARKSLPEWFAVLDAAGGPDRGRRSSLQHADELVDNDDSWATKLVVEYERARGAVAQDGRPNGGSRRATKTIAAGPDAVDAAWLDAGALAHWFGARAGVQAEAWGTIANADGDRGGFPTVRPGKDLEIQWPNPRRGAGTQAEVRSRTEGPGRTTVPVHHPRIQGRKVAGELRATREAALDGRRILLEGGTSAGAGPAMEHRSRSK